MTMPKITRTTGSGMTERAVLKFDSTDTNDIQEMIRAATETVERSSFDRLSGKLDTLATRILDAAELPSDPKISYLVTTGDDDVTAPRRHQCAKVGLLHSTLEGGHVGSYHNRSGSGEERVSGAWS